jgi:hypothetical protein
MKQWIALLILFAVCGPTDGSQVASRLLPDFVIQRPTIIAFFPPPKQPDVDYDSDTNEVLSDFQLCAHAAHPHLEKAGIDFTVTTAVSFKIRTGNQVRSFKTGKIGIGYYFIAPGKQPHVEYGVMTDTDLLDLARRYFKMAIP